MLPHMKKLVQDKQALEKKELPVSRDFSVEQPKLYEGFELMNERATEREPHFARVYQQEVKQGVQNSDTLK